VFSFLFPRPQKISATGGLLTPGEADIAIVGNALPPDGYQLEISERDGIRIRATNHRAASYALQTLAQLRKKFGAKVPCLICEDWPNLPVRGFMLDISRCKVPTMATLTELVAQLAALRINQLQLYTEHTFAFPGHEVVWRDASPMTAEDFRQLI
jgi:N-acetyl-beta-hexosaminidase